MVNTANTLRTQDIKLNHQQAEEKLYQFNIEGMNARRLAQYIVKQGVQPHMFVDTEGLWVKGKNISGQDIYILIRVVQMKGGEIAKSGGEYQILELDSTDTDPMRSDKTREVLDEFQVRVQKTI